MADAAAKEPSMEEILASIRRIIAEEGEETASDQVVSSNPETDHEPVAATLTEDHAPILGIDETIRPSISATSEQAEVVAATSAALTEQNAASEQPDEPAETVEKAVPASKPAVSAAGQTMSLADIAAGIKRPGSTDQQSQATPVAEPAAKIEPPRSSPQAQAAQSKPAVASATPSQVKAQKNVAPSEGQPEQQVLKVRLSNPEKPPEQFVSRVREAREIADRQKQEEEAAAFKGALMSPDATDEVSGSFERLRKSQETPTGAAGLEAQTERLLRKMLREWLDENLPTLVERLVREEIERVARG